MVPKIPHVWQQLEQKIAKKTLFMFWIGALCVCMAINYWMRLLWAQAKFPADVFAMQLSFSGEFLKDGYRYMLENGDLDAFRCWQIVDFAFMAAYAIVGITTALLIGGLFSPTSKNRSIAYYISTIMIIIPLLDVCENIVSLVTLADPLGFPNNLGIVHSLFALVKWTLGVIALLWAIGSLIAFLFMKKQRD
jgi:hypothetical protein